MLFFLVILGAWMGWVETVYSKPEKPLTATDSYDWDAGFTLKIPGFYRAEPAVAEAERVLKQ